MCRKTRCIRSVFCFGLFLSSALVFSIVLLSFAVAGEPVGEPAPSRLKKAFEKSLKQSALSASQLGVIVADGNNILYQLNADKGFIPASLVKIFTAGALLDLLPASLQFRTRFLSEEPLKNTVLKGALYLKGGGDSGFVSEDLWNLVNNLSRTGLKKVEGDLIVDDSRFDRKRKGPRLLRPSHAGYDAPVGALSFNWNTANLYIRSGEQAGLPARVIVDPSSSYFSSIQNQVRTVKAGQKKHIAVHRVKGAGEWLKLTGRIPASHKEVLIYRNILYPALWTGHNALAFLKQRGIALTGRVKRGKAPSKSLVLAEWAGRPLAEQVRLMMKHSNNFMVEMLLKNLVVELTGKTGSLKEGLKIIKKHIHKTGTPPGEYNLIQASGLSRKNKIQPRRLLSFLRYWQNHSLQPEFESALPLSGGEGTLKKYFANPVLKGRVRAKTGSINGVAGLAGYVVTHEGKKRTFVFIFNGSKQKSAELLFKKWVYFLWKL